MQGLSFSFDRSCKSLSLDSFVVSETAEKAHLYNSVAAKSEWGYANDIILNEDNSNNPVFINLKYRCEKSRSNHEIDFRIIPSQIKGFLVIGLGPEGNVCLWDSQINKSIIHSIFAKNTYNDIVSNWMKLFTYRIVLFFKNETSFEKQSVSIWRRDGTYDKSNDGGLMKYHQAGKPKKLRVEWHIGKSEYSAYFWFEDERIREVFDRFYGAHPDTKTDFIIRIDAEKRKYELALYRYGLKEPQVIPENVYQLLVFKNKFEDYRSDNYNQERGAWIW